jgi:hypothetical protein
MSAPRGPRLSALWMFMLGATITLVAAPAFAQFLDGTRQALAPFPRQNDRTPRLLGMGRLTLADDMNNGMTVWDLAGNPMGVWEADSVSEIQVRPLIETADAVQNLTIGNDQERQTLGGHGAGLGYELFHRSKGGTAYGAYGTLNGVKLDRPYDADTGLERSILAPSVIALLTGRMPFVATDRMRWLVRGQFLNSNMDLSYHEILANPGGSYVGIPGDEVPPPDRFTPEEYKIDATGIGVGLSYRFGSWLNFGINGDNLTAKIRGENTSVRHLSQTSENRPYWIGESFASGRIGDQLEYVVDGKMWRARNEERWSFTLAAGIQQSALTGRGFMLQRTEDGSALRTRVRWTQGALQLGASTETRYGKIEIVGPRSDDLTSFNYFLSTVSARQNADSLVLPDSVRSNAAQQHDFAYTLGGTYRLPWRAALAGAEYHWDRHLHNDRLQGEGPRSEGWDIRTGLEVPFTRVMSGRAGYVYRTDDFDTFTARNEYISHTATLGATIAHPGASWRLDAGYAYTWSAPDFPDPFEGWSGRQQFAVQLRWGF